MEKSVTKICKHCGTEIPYIAKVCPNCRRNQSSKGKWIGIGIAAFLVLGIIGSMMPDDDSDTVDKQTTSNQSEQTNDIDNESDSTKQSKDKEDKETNSEKETKNNTPSFKEEIKKYKKGNYPYITIKDLVKYNPNMKKVQFCTVIKVDDVEDKAIQATLGKGFMKSNFNSKKNYKDCIEEGDTIAIIGKVKGSKSYSILGKSLTFSDCMVIAKGKDAKKYKKKSSDQSLKKYFTITKEVANSGVDITEKEYKNLCETLDYNKILRKPKSYKDTYCKLSGTVSQVIEGFLGSVTIYIEDDSGNIWGCVYSYKDDDSHVLEGDSVVVYGKCKGTDKSKTLLGKQVVMPRIDIEYLE